MILPRKTAMAKITALIILNLETRAIHQGLITRTLISLNRMRSTDLKFKELIFH